MMVRPTDEDNTCLSDRTQRNQSATDMEALLQLSSFLSFGNHTSIRETKLPTLPAVSSVSYKNDGPGKACPLVQ